MNIAIIDYGAGNIKSLQFALQRLGYKGTLTADPTTIKQADKVLFPGVGEASSAMHKLKESGIDTLLPQLTQPVLGICLGMQLMCQYSEEGNTKGLGIFDGNVQRFNPTVKIPHMGWNTLTSTKGALFKDISNDQYMYLVHSYYLPITSQTIASTNYGGAYSTAVQNNNFYGVQFHPEKSSKAGSQLLKNFFAL